MGDETSRGELVDERAIHFLVEIEVEAIERAVGITEAGLFVPALEEAVLATHARRIPKSTRDRGREFLGSGLGAAGFEDGRHAGHFSARQN